MNRKKIIRLLIGTGLLVLLLHPLLPLDTYGIDISHQQSTGLIVLAIIALIVLIYYGWFKK